ncbi:MAG: hypothetical protein LBJ32_01460 [Oscillospiraceae bacterium]|jgi:hypothetical protein|nr:hypothetical protein [Oscillospiraceae bacterium]
MKLKTDNLVAITFFTELKFKRTNLVSACFKVKAVAPFEFEDTMNEDLFEDWLERVFVPELKDFKNNILEPAQISLKHRIFS